MMAKRLLEDKCNGLLINLVHCGHTHPLCSSYDILSPARVHWQCSISHTIEIRKLVSKELNLFFCSSINVLNDAPTLTFHNGVITSQLPDKPLSDLSDADEELAAVSESQ